MHDTKQVTKHLWGHNFSLMLSNTCSLPCRKVKRKVLVQVNLPGHNRLDFVKKLFADTLSLLFAEHGPSILFMFSSARIYREYVYSVAVYQKYLTRLGELIIYKPWRENYHFSQPRSF